MQDRPSLPCQSHREPTSSFHPSSTAAKWIKRSEAGLSMGRMENTTSIRFSQGEMYPRISRHGNLPVRRPVVDLDTLETPNLGSLVVSNSPAAMRSASIPFTLIADLLRCGQWHLRRGGLLFQDDMCQTTRAHVKTNVGESNTQLP